MPCPMALLGAGEKLKVLSLTKRARFPYLKYSMLSTEILLRALAEKDRTKFSLKPVADKLNELGVKTVFASDIVGDDAKAKIAAMDNGDVVLLENVRFDAREEKNAPDFAKALFEE